VQATCHRGWRMSCTQRAPCGVLHVRACGCAVHVSGSTCVLTRIVGLMQLCGLRRLRTAEEEGEGRKGVQACVHACTHAWACPSTQCPSAWRAQYRSSTCVCVEPAAPAPDAAAVAAACAHRHRDQRGGLLGLERRFLHQQRRLKQVHGLVGPLA